MQIKVLRFLSSLVVLLALSVSYAHAEKLSGAGLKTYMDGGPKMSFDAGSVATFSKASGKGGGTFTMRHSGQPRVKGTYSVDPKGSINLVYDNGSRQSFTIDTIKGSNKRKITYTKGPFRGNSFVYR